MDGKTEKTVGGSGADDGFLKYQVDKQANRIQELECQVTMLENQLLVWKKQAEEKDAALAAEREAVLSMEPPATNTLSGNESWRAGIQEGWRMLQAAIRQRGTR